MWQADDEIRPVVIPNQISTISVHTKSGENPLIFTLKLSSRNKNMDGMMTDQQALTDTWPANVKP